MVMDPFHIYKTVMFKRLEYYHVTTALIHTNIPGVLDLGVHRCEHLTVSFIKTKQN